MTLNRSDHVGDRRIQIAGASLRRTGKALVARRQRLEVGDARIDRMPALGKDLEKAVGLVLLHLRQMPKHVAQRNETVLDVVIDLPRELSDGRAPFHFADASSAAAQAL